MAKNYRIALETWAIQNQEQARFFLIISEILRLSVAFLLGTAAFFKPDINEVMMLGIGLLASCFAVFGRPVGRKNFGAFRSKALILFISSYLLAFLCGSFLNTRPAAGSQHTQQATAGDYTEPTRKDLLTKTLKENQKGLPPMTMNEPAREKPGLPGHVKLLYVLGFLVSLPLTWYTLTLACSLSCGGYAVFAWLAFLMAFGIFSAGVYFLIKAIRKNAKPYRELDKKGRKKEWKNFLITWLITSVTVLLALLIGNLTGS